MNWNKENKSLLYYCIMAILIVLAMNAFVFPRMMANQLEKVSYNTFLDAIASQQVNRVEVDSDEILYTLKADDSKAYATVRMDDPELVDRLYAAGATFSQVAPQKASPLVTAIFSYGLPILFFFIIWQFMARRMQSMGGNFMQFGKSNAKIYANDQTGKTFADVAGQDEAKESLT